jgi:2-polyprenyl-3-methyl-5-hydroxy-6-metoxy-1,4-benzoquinol methylase
MTLAPGFRAQLAIQVFDLQCVEGGRLLDVGCGSGAALQRLAELGWRCEGIDFDERAVEAGRARGLDVRVGSLEEQGYPAATFDAVVMNHVLEHVPDPRALLSESMRILKPGGQFACITPNAESWCHSMFGRDWRELDPPRHLHIFTQSSVGMLMQEMTWKSIEVQSSIANTHVIAWSSWQLKRSGQLDMRARPGLWGSAWGRLLQVAASLRHLADTETGEEIVVHAVKLK